jgi:hypothetical protein
MKEAYRQGCKDFQDGKTLNDNPYEEYTTESDSWMRGYVDSWFVKEYKQ